MGDSQGYNKIHRKRIKQKIFNKKKVVLLSDYNAMDEHNYCKSLGGIIIQRSNEIDSLPEWLKINKNDSDDEEDNNVKSLAELLKMEHTNYITNEEQNNKQAYVPLKRDKLFNMLLPEPLNEESSLKTKQYDYCNILNIRKNPSIVVQPPLNWVLLIYLAIKNSNKEYVCCNDVQLFTRYWFPYYITKSWITTIRSIFNNYSEYFTFSRAILGKKIMWTVKNESVKTLETKLMFIVKRYEKELKSAMKNPDQLPLLINGYGVVKLGCDNTFQKKKFK